MINKPKLSEEQIKKIISEGHNLNGPCEKCWEKAYIMMQGNGKSQAENYYELVGSTYELKQD